MVDPDTTARGSVVEQHLPQVITFMKLDTMWQQRGPQNGDLAASTIDLTRWLISQICSNVR